VRKPGLNNGELFKPLPQARLATKTHSVPNLFDPPFDAPPPPPPPALPPPPAPAYAAPTPVHTSPSSDTLVHEENSSGDDRSRDG
jgi:hypothetical protein